MAAKGIRKDITIIVDILHAIPPCGKIIELK